MLLPSSSCLFTYDPPQTFSQEDAQRMSNTPHVQFLRRGLTCWAMTGTWGEMMPCHLEQERRGVDCVPLFKALEKETSSSAYQKGCNEQWMRGINWL